MNSIELFIEFLKQALSNVHNDYYGLHWADRVLEALPMKATERDKKVLLKYFDRYGERVFCYELYHQVRTLMDDHTKENPDTFANVLLQCELQKEFIGEVVERYFKVRGLDREYIPDFLLHTPGNFKNQHIVIEVKSNPKLSFSGMKGDLGKIQQFIERYLYEKGIFLIVNTSPERIIEILYSPEAKEWFRGNISTPDKIHIFCKMNKEANLDEWSINRFLN